MCRYPGNTCRDLRTSKSTTRKRSPRRSKSAFEKTDRRSYYAVRFPNILTYEEAPIVARDADVGVYERGSFVRSCGLTTESKTRIKTDFVADKPYQDVGTVWAD